MMAEGSVGSSWTRLCVLGARTTELLPLLKHNRAMTVLHRGEFLDRFQVKCLGVSNVDQSSF